MDGSVRIPPTYVRNLTEAEFNAGYPRCSCDGYSEMPHVHLLREPRSHPYGVVIPEDKP